MSKRKSRIFADGYEGYEWDGGAFAPEVAIVIESGSTSIATTLTVKQAKRLKRELSTALEEATA